MRLRVRELLDVLAKARWSENDPLIVAGPGGAYAVIAVRLETNDAHRGSADYARLLFEIERIDA